MALEAVDALDHVRAILFDVADRNPLVLAEPEPLFIFRGFGESSLDMQFSIWATRENWLEMRNQMHLQVKAAFDAAGVEIPFPQRDLHVRSWAEHARPSESRGAEHAGRQASGKKPDTGEDGTE